MSPANEASGEDAARGLSATDAAALLVRHGPNEIEREARPSVLKMLAAQFRGAMVWLLFGACAIAAAVGETLDAAAIATVVVLNAGIGLAQELRAERAMSSLRKMTAPRARVRRDGRAVVVPGRDLVPGDVLLLDAGDIVAADGALLEANVLTVNEAALTGESAAVEKSTEEVKDDAALGDRTDRVFMGTAVAAGTGTALVTATGMGTELGRIAGLLASVKSERTPLEVRLEKVGKTLLVLCLAIAGLVAALGLLRGEPWLDVLMASVSLAVAAVPEGLAAIVTIALAIGVQRMASRNVLVRKLPAVETLGCATVICTDKTGTLTTGVMAVRELWGPDHPRLLDAGAACSDAERGESGGTGDATELAILEAAHERGIEREAIEQERPRERVNPFDSVRKRMSIRRRDGLLYVKGAVDLLLPLCTTGVDGVAEANRDMASRGLRVLAVAIGTGEEEQGLEMLGLVGIADPPRTEVKGAVRLARAAGIRTVMITGDHPLTALAIARELGIVQADEDGTDLVHARATPEDKIRIVRHWKEQGDVVAMTGDGVNDAPALREAHIGIAMGVTGTEVAKEASAMILTDDNFASIVAAIREGRGVYDNVRKTLVYLLSGNMAEIIVVLGASLIGMPLPLTALQILYINLVTDGLPAVALVMDPPDEDVLSRAPRRTSEPILGAPQWRWIAYVGAVESAVVLAVFVWTLETRDLATARTFAFSLLVFSESLRAFAARSRTRVFWETGVFTNVRLIGVVVVTVGLQLGLHYVPWTASLFGIGAISPVEGGLLFALALVPVTVMELTKLLGRLAFVARGAKAAHRGPP